MMEENKNLQPEETSPSQDVVFFAPEMLQLMERVLVNCSSCVICGENMSRCENSVNCYHKILSIERCLLKKSTKKTPQKKVPAYVEKYK